MGGTTATASQTALTFGVVESAQASAPITVSGNRLASSTMLNQARSIVTGDVPASYSSAVQGSVAAGYTTGGIASTVGGSIGISSHQSALNAGANAGSSASINGSAVTIDLQQAAAGAASSPLALTDNTQSAAFGANSATNVFSATGGVSPSFNGSVAVNNSQANVETGGGATAPTALIAGSGITADIRDRSLGGQTDLSASLALSGNTLSAASTGNAAGSRTATGIAAGNAITFASGMDVVGTSSPTANTLTNGASTLTATIGADLVLMNGQGNQGTRLESVVTDGAVTVKADNIVAGGSISSSGNTVTTAATGNLAGSLIAADSTSFAATAAAANSQSNDATSILATNTDAAVTVGVGVAGTAVTGPVSLGGNTISATAKGSDAATTIDLAAANLTALRPGATATAVTADTAGYGASSVSSGLSANNLQANYGAATPITASVTGGSVAVSAVDQTDGITLVPLSAASVTVDGNSIDAAAGGNRAATTVSLSGVNAAAQAAVGNTQFNGNIVTGQVAQSGVILRSGGVSDASALTLTGNSVAASASANDATNAVTANVTNLAVGPNAIDAVNFAASSNGVSVQSAASFGIASGQRNEGSVSASNLSADSSAAIQVGETGVAGVTDSALTATGNTVSASTTGNRVGNTLSLTTTNLDTEAGAATRIGGVASLQVNEVTGVANASVGGSTAAVTRVGIAYQEGLSGSTLTASDNAISAVSRGNDATNRLSAAGGSLVSAAPVAASGLVSSPAGTIQSEFALLNQQTDSVSGGRTASADGVTAGINGTGVLGSVSDSTLTVGGNQIVAEARNNSASNAASLVGFTQLTSSAGLLNQQSSDTAVSANVTQSAVRIQGLLGTTIDGSTLAMTNNMVQGLAVGSSASNALTVQAGNLSGNANFASATPASDSATADFAVVNDQSQQAGVTALVGARVRMALGNSVITDSSLTLSDNSAAAVAQATSASNTLSLAGTSVANVNGALASSQNTAGATSATLQPEVGGAGVATIYALSVDGTPVAVNGNNLLASAGQNEAFNTQRVTGTSIAGKALDGTPDFSIENGQTGAGSVTASALPGQLGLVVNSITSGSVAVSGNAVTANANVNNSANALSLAAASTVAATAQVANTQSAVTGDTISANVGSLASRASVGTAPASLPGYPTPAFGDADVSVSGNQLAASAGSNTAVNSVAVTGTTVTGGVNTSPSFRVSNDQFDTSTITADSVVGVVGVTAGRSLGTSMSITDNSVSAAAQGNTARTTQTLSADGTLTGSAVVANTQQSFGSAIAASIDATAVGVQTPGASAFSGGPMAVTGNDLTAEAGGNTGVNVLAAYAATLTGQAAGFGIQTSQFRDGSTTATNTTGLVGVTTGTGTNNSFSVTGNTVGAQANGNRITNWLDLGAGGTLSAQGFVNNDQQSLIGGVSATVSTAAVGLVTNALDNSPVAVSGNRLTADASHNVATNDLTARAITLNGTGAAPSLAINSNQQGPVILGDVTATNTVGLIGATQGNAFGGSTFSVTDNTAASSANVNIVTNRLALNAGGALAATAEVRNVQDANSSTVSATTGGASIGAPATIGIAPFSGVNTLTGGAVTVSGNSLNAQGGGNTALNALEATAVASIAGGAFPTFAVLNTQSNAASVNTTVQYANIGASVSALSGSSAAVQSNFVVASSYGNSASNSIGLTALPGAQNQASASLTNTQTNYSSIASAVNSVNVGVMGGGAAGGSITVGGNSTTAQSIGNSARNVISAK